jgi:hypothetical protein
MQQLNVGPAYTKEDLFLSIIRPGSLFRRKSNEHNVIDQLFTNGLISEYDYFRSLLKTFEAVEVEPDVFLLNASPDRCTAPNQEFRLEKDRLKVLSLHGSDLAVDIRWDGEYTTHSSRPSLDFNQTIITEVNHDRTGFSVMTRRWKGNKLMETKPLIWASKVGGRRGSFDLNKYFSDGKRFREIINQRANGEYIGICDREGVQGITCYNLDGSIQEVTYGDYNCMYVYDEEVVGLPVKMTNVTLSNTVVKAPPADYEIEYTEMEDGLTKITVRRIPGNKDTAPWIASIQYVYGLNK